MPLSFSKFGSNEHLMEFQNKLDVLNRAKHNIEECKDSIGNLLFFGIQDNLLTQVEFAASEWDLMNIVYALEHGLNINDLPRITEDFFSSVESTPLEFAHFLDHHTICRELAYMGADFETICMGSDGTPCWEDDSLPQGNGI